MRRPTILLLLAWVLFGMVSSAYAEPAAVSRGTQLGSLPRSGGAESSVRTALAAAVLLELQRDSSIDARNIDVGADDGVITLTGRQSMLLACDRAAYIAETVPGVRRVVNRLSVRQAREADTQRLESDVIYVLLTDPATEHQTIRVSANALGRVTLSGTVGSYYERYLAGQAVRGVVGATGIRNDIEIANNRPLQDRQIVADIQQALAWDAYVDSRHIDVSAEQGVVTLMGAIDSAAQKRRSIMLSWVAGVRDVNAKLLRVADAPSPHGTTNSREWPAAKSDKDIVLALRGALRADPRLRDAEIQVAARDRMVVLVGTIDRLAARRVAETIASGLRGVVSVDNRLRVPAQAQVFSDAEIAARIERSLARNSATCDDAIAVSVVDAAVTLEGDAHHWLSRQLAENAAAAVRGVHEVVNEIVVAGDVGSLSFNPYVDAGPVAWTND